MIFSHQFQDWDQGRVRQIFGPNWKSEEIEMKASAASIPTSLRSPFGSIYQNMRWENWWSTKNDFVHRVKEAADQARPGLRGKSPFKISPIKASDPRLRLVLKDFIPHKWKRKSFPCGSGRKLCIWNRKPWVVWATLVKANMDHDPSKWFPTNLPNYDGIDKNQAVTWFPQSLGEFPRNDANKTSVPAPVVKSSSTIQNCRF